MPILNEDTGEQTTESVDAESLVDQLENILTQLDVLQGCQIAAVHIEEATHALSERECSEG